MFRTIAIVAIMGLFCIGAVAQATTITYQGSLKNAGVPANGNYDFEFDLYTAETGGTFVGGNLVFNIPVENGYYSVTLGYAMLAWNLSPKWMQIYVKPTGTGTWIPLSPRQQITQAPYSIRSADSLALGGIAPTGFIQNTTAQQAASNFNISGNGSVGGRLRVEGITGGSLASFGANGRFQVDSPGIPGGRFEILEAGDVVVGINGAFVVDQTSFYGGRFYVGTNGKVGIGANNPSYRLHIVDTSNAGLRVQTNTAGGNVASFGGNGAFGIDGPGSPGGRFTVLENGNIGIGTAAPIERFHQAVGFMRLDLLGGGGTTQLCRNGANQISACASSIRYKQNINTFSSGLDLIRRLRPVSFNWKQGGAADMGLVAEEVAELEPLLVTQNDKGEIEGVKYDRIGVVLINAVKEQQAQIETLKRTVDQQQTEIDALKKP